MRILYIANSRLPTEKAHGLQIVKTVEAFIEEEAYVKLIIPRRNNPIQSTISDYYNIVRIPDIVYVKNYFGFLERYFHHPYFIVQRFSFTLAALFLGLLSREDIVYSREITLCFLLALFGKKVVFEDHEPKKKMRRLYFLFIKVIGKKVIVPPMLGDLYAKNNVDKESYIIAPNGVDVKEIKNISGLENDKIPQTEKIVMYVGHFYRWKGVYTLIDAAPSINARIMLVGGNDADRMDVEEYIRSKGVTNASILPFLPHREVLRLMKTADVLVLPNTADEERSAKYTTPIKLFEYMASGRPIVSSDIPSVSHFLKDGENAILAVPDDHVDFAEKISLLLKDPEKSKIIAERAMTDALNYTWTARAKKILSFVQY
ncbi:MAG: hypothetical protein A3G52_03465 [Candidatus Taylorbacteria bacterium RIFCSPLOWO2_12_FULL_43_20]|uniref:Glycosyl transferase family 1 domain-containing protein n=1 Tax=Candidatus Taylorbacteria bacterium RIFCSPLOWO2_12_FULL_43_20 TaxID=1802332 RepID=A0A1G2P0J6_9BACT|nr:MAG: hypothetical protein A2825_02410 [Candidatus Taylorbacteria bacterium RIFCSPHIGHO2_01_FULL_43_120]OHA22406.1 MAG: hypothetical protein A3B98_02310 [Candidatus Taylorbacteria bacterium RIFCSPHIGHO2_02_FULL_43_55]OHA28345.1 MAG: hypothetical protein A3E92_00480 [Candidatus Taylorbacteria bacterium RIFCSPHIGHO2_12_FULL_42_34]OHA30619.1 MAG: hypothetical protein A3B09_00360 [Candidatus Taylorbacteria bacterium RIFCSPLOWO2_01_FULL_43_83]OHA38516.1 MAG: hypothetical protein A3H58_03005 [Candi